MTNKQISKTLFSCTAILFSLLVFLHEPLAAQSIKEIKGEGSDFPTNITSQRMHYDANKQQVRFEGSVKVRRPDFNLDSDKLTIFFKKNKNKSTATGDPLSSIGGGDIDRMIAVGNVLMVRDGRKGNSGKVTYFLDKELIVMEQDPVLTEGKNTIKGQKINFYVRENRSEVIGSETAPVKVHFSSPKPKQGE